jgi:predicted ATPase
MKTTRIDIEGRQGRATIFRSGSDIVINITRLAGRDLSWVEPVKATAFARRTLAQRLQCVLDGLDSLGGANGDIAEYLRVIETFTD